MTDVEKLIDLFDLFEIDYKLIERRYNCIVTTVDGRQFTANAKGEIIAVKDAK
jgi:hypothetical protein